MDALSSSEGHGTMVEGQRHKSAPTGAGTPTPGPRRPKDNDRLMGILPCPPGPSSTCTDPHVDGCPECVINLQTAEALIHKEDRCIAAYICSDCGHSWTTTWGCR